VVVLNRIYTRTGDGGTTRLVGGATVSKAAVRIEAIGAVDEVNACLGIARLSAGPLEPLIARLQNELFDLGADLATPLVAGDDKALRIIDSQVAALENDIDGLNADLPALTSFVLPGGTPTAAALHLARTVCRRAEREAVRLGEAGEAVNGAALRYLNRLSDLLFVAARHANREAGSELTWEPGRTR
jgi:cob(I)alamin adenosyltransferase